MSEENNEQVQEIENNQDNEVIEDNAVKEETVEKEGEEPVKAQEEAPAEEPQEEPKEEIQEEPKEEIQEVEVQPQEEAQEEPKEEVQEEPKEEVQEEPKEETQEEPKEENQVEIVEEQNEEPKGETVELTQEQPLEEPKEENNEEVNANEEPNEENDNQNDVQEEGNEEKQDNQSENEENEEKEKEEEIPTEIILFSTLSKEDKIKYFNFFIANDTGFEHEPEGTWIAEIDVFDDDDKEEENEVTSSKQSDIKNLRQSAFRSTKKDYDAIYSKLINVINPSPGIKGKKMDINLVKYMIQEIYSLKFLKDTKSLFNKDDSEPESFPVFVGNFLINKFPKKASLHKKAVDFMLSLDFYGLKHKDIKVFQQFVTEEYDSDDLIFYLFVRSCIEKELKVFFVEKAKDNLGQGLLYEKEDNDILVPVKKCEKLAKNIFGAEETDLINTFMENIKSLLETDAADKKKKHLKANAILNISLENYHNSRGKVDEVDEDKEKDSDEEGKKKKKKEKKKKGKGKEKDKKKHKKKKEKEEEETKVVKAKEENSDEEKETKEVKDENEEKEEKNEEEKNEEENNNEDNIEKEKEEEKGETEEKEKEDNNDNNSENEKEEKNEEENDENKEDKEEKEEKEDNDNSEKEEKGEEKSEEKESEEEKITKKKPTKIRAKKKSNLKSSSKPKTSSGTKTKTPGTNTASKTDKKLTKAVTTKTVLRNANKTAISKDTPSSRITSSGNKSTAHRTTRKGSQEQRGLSKKKKTTGSSVGKRKTGSTEKRNLKRLYGDDYIEQSLEFRKILNRNRIEKCKTETDKPNYLLLILNDYFKIKEIEPYFKSIVEKNPIFQTLSAKINTHMKSTKEFTLKKLSGICKYISAGDKEGYYNFMKIRDKHGKGNYEALRGNYNNLLRSGPLKNLDENDVKDFCKMVLDIPELTIQTTKSLLKSCE